MSQSIEFKLQRYFTLLGIAIMFAGVIFIHSFADENTLKTLSKKENLFAWLLITYALVHFYLWRMEIFYAKTQTEFSSYKDISLEFCHVKVSSEKEILDAFNEISNGKVLELSLIYDLSIYYKLQKELKGVNKSNDVDKASKLTLLNSKMESFLNDFKRNKSAYFIGRGFVTFKNFIATKSFKDLHAKVYRKLTTSRIFGKKVDLKIENLKEFQRELKNPNNVKNSNETEKFLKKTDAPAFRRSDTVCAPKDRQHFKDDMRKNTREKQSTSANVELGQKMRQLFGETFRIERGIDPETVNFKFTENHRISAFFLLKNVTIVFFIIPIGAYLFNYLYYYLDIGLFLGSYTSLWTSVFKNASLVITVIIDQIAFGVIEEQMKKERFLNHSRMHSFKMFFYSVYILISNIIVPNFAMKQAFLKYAENLDSIEKAKTLQYLLNSAFVVYYILIFGAINYKIIKPLIAKRKVDEEKQKPFRVNEHINFNISFVINCIFYVSFYGTITPSIFVLLGVTLVLNFVYDLWFEMKLFWEKKALRKKSDSNKQESIDESFDENGISKLPATVFSSAVWILCVGVFLLAVVGFFGVTSDINAFLSLTENPTLQSNSDGLFQNIEQQQLLNTDGRGIRSFVSEMITSGFNNLWVGSVYTFTTSLYYLMNDSLLRLGLGLYIIVLIVFKKFNNSERFLNRIQSRIWSGKEKVEEFIFFGKSYRELNPVYKLLSNHSR